MDDAEKRHLGRDARGTVPVELGPGIVLWDVALREFGFVVGQQACNTETLKTLAIFLFFFTFVLKKNTENRSEFQTC